MALEYNISKKGHGFDKFIIFVSLSRHFCRSNNSFFSLLRLATGSLGFTKGLFLFPKLKVFKRFYSWANVAYARIKRFRYISLRLVFEKAGEPFRLNNQKTQSEQCLRVDNSRSGFTGFSLLGWGITEAPLTCIHSKRGATNHPSFELSTEWRYNKLRNSKSKLR
jgi:hypothetical protein